MHHNFTDAAEKRTRILVVDDCKENCEVIRDYLEIAGYEVVTAMDGETCLDILSNLRCDMVLLDVMMPGMDGFAVCSRIRENEKTKDIPVIFLTARAEIENVLKGFALGAQDYVVKPFQQAEVLARIQLHLTLKKQKQELEDTLEKVKTLSRLLPICPHCKKIRNDNGYWEKIEAFFQSRTDADFSHSICPDCLKARHPELAEKDFTPDM